jgi:nucleoside-diphosphate-sugar epimerase
MQKVLLTGATGFVGKNLILRFEGNFEFITLARGDCVHEVKEFDAIINLAGVAQDHKTTKRPDDYYRVNTEIAKEVFSAFTASEAKVFITLSSVKAVADEIDDVLTEEHVPNPITHYGRSKLYAENSILSQDIPSGKRVYVLRPCMIHGPGNKGNLNLLFKLVSKGIPWPLGAFENQRSFCSIDNLMFILNELIEREDIPSGVYNVADDAPLSTNEVISILAESQNRDPRIWNISKSLVMHAANIGSIFKLPLNEERLQKLTNSYVVSNKKLMRAVGKPLPVSSRQGLLITFQSFQ